MSLASQESDVLQFSFGQHITAVAAGRLNPELNRDVLVIGSQTNILAYDVETNSELFYKDVSLLEDDLNKHKAYILFNSFQMELTAF